MTPRDTLLARLGWEVLVFDGAMGTLLLGQIDLAGRPPEQLNLDRPDLVEAVHREYVTAGAQIIQTNTFGATSVKLAAFGLAGKTAEVCRQAVAAARRAAGNGCLVAGCIGPTGALLTPFGQLSADEAYAAFRAQATALASAGVDLFNIETMTDVLEAKLALIAARDVAPDVPVMVSITFDRGMRTLTGTDPATAAAILVAAGADVIGTNCGTGPAEALAALEAMHAVCDLPLLIKPNAGLPHGVGSAAIHSIDAAEFAAWVPAFIKAGANVVGGCCGTTPAHLRAVADQARGATPGARGPAMGGCLASASKLVFFGAEQPTRIIGERINPSRRPDLQQALRGGDWSAIAAEARRQVAAGADVIDVNVGYRVPRISEASLMSQAVQAVQHACAAPLSIDTRDATAMEAAIRVIRGKPLLNSTTADPATLEAILGLAVRYGAAVIGLPLDGDGVPETASARLRLVDRIVKAAAAAGLPPADLIIDGLTLTAGMHGRPAMETLATITAAKDEFGVSTVLGVSNVSHGLPAREEINMAFLSMAQAAGLDLALINPLHPGAVSTVRAGDVLSGRDLGARRFIQLRPSHAAVTAASTAAAISQALPPTVLSDGTATAPDLAQAIIDGDSPAAGRAAAALAAAGQSPLAIINEMVVPALATIGDEYEAQRAYLPQLLLAAEAAHSAFAVLEPLLTAGGPAVERGKVILATVRGDMHDIGKNIIALLLRSHGFQVIDLGRDVTPERVVEAARAERPAVIGLSALMTTTMTEMGTVMDKLAAAGINVPVIVGGAVLNAEYAAEIGAEYAPDAVSGVRRIGELATIRS